MGLKEECKNYKKVIIEPTYGWGWTCTDTKDLSYLNKEGQVVLFSASNVSLLEKAKVSSYKVPEVFSCEIQYFFYVDDELRGCVGTIVEKGHEFVNYGIVFYTRIVGEYNFTDTTAYYNIDIASQSPVYNPSFSQWPEFACGLDIYNGYGSVFGSIIDIRNFHASKKKQCSCSICIINS